jgi:hypothetical protein
MPRGPARAGVPPALNTPRRLLACAIVSVALVLNTPLSAWGTGELKFGTAPALPTLPATTPNAHSQAATATLTSFAVTDTTGSGKGWKVTVQGQTGTGKSAVFAQYCPEAAGCGADALGYVTSGKTLPAASLTLKSTGATFTGGSGGAPTLQCSTACNIDNATAVKIASAAEGGAGAGTWTTTGFSSSSLALATATTLRSLPAKEVYRVNILWTLATGP